MQPMVNHMKSIFKADAGTYVLYRGGVKIHVVGWLIELSDDKYHIQHLTAAHCPPDRDFLGYEYSDGTVELVDDYQPKVVN
jgi:hypothetical protein